MTYLIRRMNQNGHWLTIGQLDYVPKNWFGWDAFIRTNYGPGRYHIGRVERGLSGMQTEGLFNIGYNHEFVQWLPEKPNLEYITSHGIHGDLIIAKLAETEYFYVPRNDPVVDEQIQDQLDQGIQGFKGGWVIFRILDLPYQ